MKYEKAPSKNMDRSNLLKKYQNEIANHLGFKSNTNLSDHTKSAIETSIQKILEGNESAARTILEMKLNVYKNSPKLEEYIPEFEKIIKETLKNTADHKKSYDKDLAAINEVESSIKKEEEKIIKEKEEKKKIEDENRRKIEKEEKTRREEEAKKRYLELAAEEEKEHKPPVTIESITIPPDIRIEYTGDNEEEKPAKTKKIEKPKDSTEIPTDLIVGDIMESERLVRRINNYLKVTPHEKMYVIKGFKPYTDKNGKNGQLVFLKGENREVKINEETLIKMIEDNQKNDKKEKYTYLKKGDIVLVGGKKYEIISATNKTIKFKEDGADIPVNIDRDKMEDILSKNKFEIKRGTRVKKTKDKIKDEPEIITEDLDIKEEIKKEDLDIKSEEEIIKKDLDTKEEIKVEPEIINEDLDKMDKMTKNAHDFDGKITHKNTHELKGKDTIESLRTKSAAAQAAGDYEAAELYEKSIKELNALDKKNKKKKDEAMDKIAKLDEESKKAQAAGDYERAQELEDMKNKHKEKAEYTAKIEDLNESEKESLPPGGFRAEEDKKESVIVNYGGFDDKNAATAEKVETVKKDIESRVRFLEVEKAVERAREAYMNEYKNCLADLKKDQKTDNVKRRTFNFMAGAKNIWAEITGGKRIEKRAKKGEEDFYSDKLKVLKEEYDKARIQLGNEMYANRKAELVAEGVTGVELEEKLTLYKAETILDTVITKERQKTVEAKADMEKKLPKGFLKSIWEGYKNIQPAWKKYLLSTLIFTGAAAGGLGAAGIVGYAGARFAKSLLAGTVVGHGVKGIDYLNRNKDAKFAEEHEAKYQEAQKKFGQGELDLEEYEKYAEKLASIKDEKEKKRFRTKAAVGMLLGAGVAFGTYQLLGGADHHEVPKNGEGQPWPPVAKPDHSLDVTIDKGQGMIHFAGQLKHAVAEKWGSDMSNAPESVKHIMNTSSEDLAKEFGGFKPGQINESAMLNKGANFNMDDQGNLKFTDPKTGESEYFVWGQDITKGADYHGDMFDYKGGSHVNSIQRGVIGEPHTINPFNNGQEAIQLPGENTQIESTIGGGSIELNSISDLKKYGISPEQFSVLQKLALEKHVIDSPLVMPDGHLDQVQLLKMQDYAIEKHIIDKPILNIPANTVLENSVAGGDPFKGFNSIDKIHEVQNAQLADLKNQLGEKDYNKLMTDLKTKGINYESDGKTLRVISIGKSPDLEHIQSARDASNDNAFKEIMKQTGLDKVSPQNSKDTYNVSIPLSDGTYADIIVRETHTLNGHEVSEIISQHHAVPNPDTLNQAGSVSKTAETLADAKINTAAGSVVENKIHSGFSNVAKAFPMEEKVAGLSREQFDKIALHEIKADLNLDANTELIETPDVGHRLWMYENFGTISQASGGQDQWDMTPPDVNLGKIKDVWDFMDKKPNDPITIAIKNLESRVVRATGMMGYNGAPIVSASGLNAEEYTKRLIGELYKK